MDIRQWSLQEGLQKNAEEFNRWTAFRGDQVQAIENLHKFQKHLEVEIMVPIGNKALLPGHLYHTNEVLVTHYNGIFSKCTVQKAHEILQARVEVASEHLRALETERELLLNRQELPQNAFSDETQQEIIEEYDEEKEKEWRVRHRESVRRHKQHEAELRKAGIFDEEESLALYFERLEEQELIQQIEEMFADEDEEEKPVNDGAGGEPLGDEKEKSLSDEIKDFPVDEAVKEFPGKEAGEKPPEGEATKEFPGILSREESTEERPGKEAQKEPPGQGQAKESSGKASSDDPSKGEASKNPPQATEEVPSGEILRIKRKSLTFSDQDSIQLIEVHEAPCRASRQLPPENKLNPDLTLHLEVIHTPAIFCPPKTENPEEVAEITSPADIYRVFGNCLESPECVPKSILKNKEAVEREIHLPAADPPKLSTNRRRLKEVISVDHSSILGEIIERKPRGEEPGTPEEATKASKRTVSRFRAAREGKS
ncbi:unconventional prefoldin RPB5 interactor-like protein [Lutzomyia longipalpis]|uniref:unconventional prefoldin RPB5 interactor-like protein n=1 Tax=Lutzomyia longipalpis TaxID=7200 RepID=UPI0024845A2D|nr:unconventional prefoldin RPB5 interactor-like protein [Lutzomyia longipalpis]